MGPIRPSPLRGRWGDMDEGPPTSLGLCARDRRNMDGNDSREHGCPTRRPSKRRSKKMWNAGPHGGGCSPGAARRRRCSDPPGRRRRAAPKMRFNKYCAQRRFLLHVEPGSFTFDLGMRVAIYCRVSTADQNCEMQLRELRDYAAARKLTVYAEYVDTGWSGAKASRPELNRLMSDARKRRFDAVLCWKLDRWGRSVADSINSIRELTSLGVRFVAVTQNIDTDESNPMARFLLHILAALAELEREIIRERAVAGVKAARANGKQLGRPRHVFRRDEAVRLRAEGMAWRKIAAKLGVPVTSVVEGCR